MTISRFAKMLGSVALLASTFLVVSAAAESKVRIVRLSDVEGSVQIERAAGEGLEKAFLNLPMVEGSRLKTGNAGRAEVEFEDNSTVRIGPNSELSFKHLALGDDGQKLNDVQLISGTAYANFHQKKGDQFQLEFAQESIAVPDAAHFRAVLDGSHQATIAVFKGTVTASGPSGNFEVAEKHSATIDLASTDPAKKDAFVVAKHYHEDPLDGWDREQNDYHERYASAAGSSFSSPYGYGVSDLNYYGSFMTIPGYGYGWQPFFVNAGWSPFMDGAWAWYPGAGYMFVSGYPWGWMPYYYGNWAQVPGYGWMWQPGAWNSWSGVPRVVNPSATLRLPAPPVSGHQTVLLGKGLTANPMMASGKLTIKPGSAGLGVPRGSVHNLNHVARTMERNPRPVVVAMQPPVQASNGGFGSGSSLSGGSSAMSSSAMSRTSAPSHASAPSGGPHK
ncbi:MAG: FecR family protein [Terriglobales bacterium]